MTDAPAGVGEALREQPIFDIKDRGYRVRAFYVPDTLLNANHAHFCITHNGELVELGYYMAYCIWNLAAHFHDIVDELERKAATQ